MDDFHEIPNVHPNLNSTPLSTALLNVPLSATLLTDEQDLRVSKINEIKDYFVPESKERELMSKGLSKYIASFDYFDKSLIALSVTTGSISIASFSTVIGAPVGMASASFSLAFSNCTRIVKKLLKTTRSKLINNEISHEDFMIVINEEKKYRELKESIRMMNSQRNDIEKINLIEDLLKSRFIKNQEAKGL